MVNIFKIEEDLGIVSFGVFINKLVKRLVCLFSSEGL